MAARVLMTSLAIDQRDRVGLKLMVGVATSSKRNNARTCA